MNLQLGSMLKKTAIVAYSLSALFLVLGLLLFATQSASAQVGTGTPMVDLTATAAAGAVTPTGAATLAPTATTAATSTTAPTATTGVIGTATVIAPVVTGTAAVGAPTAVGTGTALVPVTGADQTQGPDPRTFLDLGIGLLGLALVIYGLSVRLSKSRSK